MTKQATITERHKLPYKLIGADTNGAWSIWRDGEQYIVEASHGPSGRALNRPIVVDIKATWTEAEVALAKHIIQSMHASAGVHRDYIDYFMGHVTPTYNSIKSKGVEFLRRIYISSGLSIKPKIQITKMEILKEMVRSLGYDPERILVKEAFMQPHRTVIDNEGILRKVIREVLKKSV